MTRGVQWSLVCFLLLIALIALAGCSHYLFAEREPWRHDAEIACLNTRAVKETPQRVRISAISGPGICGMDYPLRIAALGDNPPLAYDADPPRPPGNIPTGALPQAVPRDLPPVVSQGWPDALSRKTPPIASQPIATQRGEIQSRALPPVQTSEPPYDPYAGYSAPSRPAPIVRGGIGQPLSINPPGVSAAEPDDEELGIPGDPPHPYYGGPQAPYSPGVERNPNAAAPLPPLGPLVTASTGLVEVSPPATLACPMVAALDQWITTSVQPAAMRWFHQPVVEIKQISAYSCRGMNGDPNAHISEHAFGNALDIAEFDLADDHVIKVQYGWHGTPEEQGFLHDVQSAACDQFATVLAPGANIYHYNHIHVDLMRRASGRRICEPAAIPGDVAAARAGGRFAAQRYGNSYADPGVTGSIAGRSHRREAAEDDDRRPSAIAGED